MEIIKWFSVCIVALNAARHITNLNLCIIRNINVRTIAIWTRYKYGIGKCGIGIVNTNTNSKHSTIIFVEASRGCKRDRLWIRFPFEVMKYLIFSFIRSGVGLPLPTLRDTACSWKEKHSSFPYIYNLHKHTNLYSFIQQTQYWMKSISYNL